MVDLQKCREEIDKIDQQIVELFEQRMKVSTKVAEYKIQTGKKVLDQEREEQKLNAVEALAKEDYNRHSVRELFTQIMSMSRKLQYSRMNSEQDCGFCRIPSIPKTKDTKVVFFGASGSYTEQAMEECFGTEVTSFPAATFHEVMEAVANKKADYGVLPIENTTTGGITDSYDLLVEFDNHIVAEHVIKVEQALVVLPGTKLEEIKKVYSHPQAILQCRKFLEQHPNIQVFEEGSTAGCAKKVLEDQDRSQAAIASIRAAKTYGLEVLAPHINYENVNSTRFIIITNKKEYCADADKMSICFSLLHESGTLYNMLSHIIYNNLNMSKIVSRPLAGKRFEYRFFVDFDGSIEEAGVINTLRGIEAEALEMKILGNYRTL
ncbi:MAG: prephenate dehydratase [Clostridiales bacterium]|nr:prephenate dehydratase [Clostridiales bacterium]